MGWPCSSSSIARLMRLALGVWATIVATPRTTQKQASKESSVVFILIDIRWGLLMTSNSVLRIRYARVSQFSLADQEAVNTWMTANTESIRIPSLSRSLNLGSLLAW